MGGPVLEAKVIISAEDRVSAVFAKIEARAEKMAGHFKTLDRVARESTDRAGSAFGRGDVFARLEKTQAKLATSLDRMARSVDTLAKSPMARRGGGSGGGGDAPSRRRGGGHGGGSHLAGFAAAYEIAEIAGEAGRAAVDRVHEESRMRLSGMTPDEISRAKIDAANLSASMPAVGMTEIMHEQRNARAVVGSTAEAAPLMRDLIRLRVVAQAARPGEDVTEDMDLLVKGLEIGGVTQDPKKFHEYMDGVAKGLNTFGDTLKASEYYRMMLYGRQATPRLSEDFVLGTAPTLAQELRGSSYGRAVSAFNRAVVGGRMTDDAMKEMQTIGLVGKGDLDKKGKLKPGASIAGWQVAQSDPDKWVKDFLLPAMKSHGITDPDTIAKVIGMLFSNAMAAQMVSTLALQQPKIEKDRALLKGAMGLDGADYAVRSDPAIVFPALKTQLESLAATVGEGMARALAPIASDLTVGLAKYNAILTANNEFIAKHPGQDTPIDKQSRRAFNQLAYGADTDKGILTDPNAPEFMKAAYLKRRALLLKWRDEKIDDSAEVARIENRRKHVAPGFEASAKAQDDADEYPMRAAAAKQLAELDKAYAAWLAAYSAKHDAPPAGAVPMPVPRPHFASDAPAPAPAPTSVGPYGALAPMPQPAPPVPPRSLEEIIGKLPPPAPVVVTPAPVNVSVEPGNGLIKVVTDTATALATAKAAAVDAKAARDVIDRYGLGRAAVGTSMPETQNGGPRGLSRP